MKNIFEIIMEQHKEDIIPRLPTGYGHAKLIEMPLRIHVLMSAQHAIRIHINNLVNTFGEELVMTTLIEDCKPRRAKK